MNQSETSIKSPAPPIPAPLNALDAAGNGVQLRFVWQGDRFGHVIEMIKAGAPTYHLLQSRESDAKEYWPTSPPIQQLSLEQIGNAPTALGVGATGGGHWSISVHAEQIQDKLGLLFDVALKVSIPPVRCGSGYTAFSDDSPKAMPQAKPFEILPLSKIAPTNVQLTSSVWQIVPQQTQSQQETNGIKSDDMHGTIRWAYFISLA